MKKLEQPAWEKDVDTYKGIKQYIIEGDVTDIYLSADGKTRMTIEEKIEEIFEKGETQNHYMFLSCNPITGFSSNQLDDKTLEAIIKKSDSLNKKEEDRVKKLCGASVNEPCDNNLFTWTSKIINTLLTSFCGIKERKSIGIIVNYAGQYLTSADNFSVNETQFFSNLRYGIDHAIAGDMYINSLFLIVNNTNNLPAWFTSNPNIRKVIISKPDRIARERYIDVSFDMFKKAKQSQKEKLIDLTDRLTLKEVDEIRRLISQKKLSESEIEKAVRIYKYGVHENQWEQTWKKLASIDIEESLKKRVIGQDEAVHKIACGLKSACTGLSSVGSTSGEGRPRCVFFLDGPSGTGKTEIVKAVGQLLFEDQSSIQRFDMSEYSEKHSDQRLFGAPPGYVGYSEGGQLTNAVRNNPFAILLFDEIEKGHPSIMDKFLQVLEDGRLTDGQGNTVDFSQTVIFFTSNAGMQKRIIDPGTGGEKLVNIVRPDEPHSAIKKKVIDELRNVFKAEVLNRIGEDNIIIFNFIDKESSEAIVMQKIELINTQIKKIRNIDITITNSAVKKYCELCMAESVRINGGRGIKMMLESQYVKPLASYIYENKMTNGGKIKVDLKKGKIDLSLG